MSRRWPGWMLGAVCALGVLTGCTDDDPAPPERIAYSAAPESIDAGEGIDRPVKLVPQSCFGVDESLDGYRPAGWDVVSAGAEKCAWSDPRGDGTLTFAYEVSEKQAWRQVAQANSGQTRNGTIPGYEVIRMSQSDETGSPLWHYRYVDEGATVIDSYNLFRGHWHITYEADSARFNTYIADQLRKKVTVER